MHAHRSFVGSVVLLLALGSGDAFATVRYVNNDGICGGNLPCYTTLAAAIAASSAGDEIRVQPGLYNTAAMITVDRPLLILGPQAGVNALPSQGSTRVPGDATSEGILDGGGVLGTIVRITASDVEINGLEIRNGTGDLVDSPASLALARVTIRNNIIHGSSGDEGVQLRNVADALIECNRVYGTAGDGINLCCGATNGIIRFNELHDIASLDAAVYVYNSTNTTIEGNLVYRTANNEAIKLGAKNGSDAAGTGGVILNNRVYDLKQDGVAVYQSNTEVRCNEIYNSTSENGGIYLAYAISNVSVEDNYVHDNTFNTAKWGDPAGIMIGTAVNAPSITVTGNRLVNNSPNGATNRAVGLLTARNNWWGAADGPGPVGPGSGDLVSTNIDFTPWLTSAPAPSCPSVGSCGTTPTPSLQKSWGQIKLLYR
ncbi:MAG: hypothetical protein A2W00_00285 [Candidatus Eisenbacteria bacterium RBG_16_71_46]|nr:MAG: hypothetical protein A2W00_00285 [Candidatus Eisenbacteria bacterium RBG_16_71_46]OGF24545.1 MAG: hypothetical protein A2V63_01485 [Candidatus Eisenbacteria bacterium RBG_19FT_COMBO_70_11]